MSERHSSVEFSAQLSRLLSSTDESQVREKIAKISPAVCQVLHVLMIEIPKSPAAPLVPFSPLNQMSATRAGTQSAAIEIQHAERRRFILAHCFSVFKTPFCCINDTDDTNIHR